LYRECLAGAQIIFPENGRGLGYVTPTIFGSTVGYPSDSLASCIWFTLCKQYLGKQYNILLQEMKSHNNEGCKHAVKNCKLVVRVLMPCQVTYMSTTCGVTKSATELIFIDTYYTWSSLLFTDIL